MRCVSLLLPVLLVACSQQPTEDLAAALAADPVRPPSFDIPISDQDAMPFEGDVP